MHWLWLALGGGLGAVARYALTAWVDGRLAMAFPAGTLAVNAAGCFAIGIVATLADEGDVLTPAARLFLVSGLLGGFTTFSAFGLDTVRLVEDGRTLAAVGNALGSVVLGVLAVAAGMTLTRQLT